MPTGGGVKRFSSGKTTGGEKQISIGRLHV